MDIKGHAAVVTGGASGLGAATASELARAGASVTVLDVNLDGARAVAEKIGGEALYGRYWGAVEEHPCLHFEVCYYQAIDFAIQHGLKRVEAGAQGAHKLARGYLPVPTYSAHWIRDGGLRRAVGDYLKRERRAVANEIALLGAESPYRKA